MISVESRGFKELNQYLRALIGYLQNPSRTFARIKPIMMSDVGQHFDEQEGPDGEWEPLKLSTLKARWYKRHGGGILTKKGDRSKGGAVEFFGKAKILEDEGHLKDSINTESGKNYAEIGTNLPYAKPHQFGWPERHIPRRTFIFLSEDAAMRGLDLIISDLKDIA
jgi:phage gpG-like protein